jgi:hypothetical protein
VTIRFARSPALLEAMTLQSEGEQAAADDAFENSVVPEPETEIGPGSGRERICSLRAASALRPAASSPALTSRGLMSARGGAPGRAETAVDDAGAPVLSKVAARSSRPAIPVQRLRTLPTDSMIGSIHVTREPSDEGGGSSSGSVQARAGFGRE